MSDNSNFLVHVSAWIRINLADSCVFAGGKKKTNDQTCDEIQPSFHMHAHELLFRPADLQSGDHGSLSFPISNPPAGISFRLIVLTPRANVGEQRGRFSRSQNPPWKRNPAKCFL